MRTNRKRGREESQTGLDLELVMNNIPNKGVKTIENLDLNKIKRKIINGEGQESK